MSDTVGYQARSCNELHTATKHEMRICARSCKLMHNEFKRLDDTVERELENGNCVPECDASCVLAAQPTTQHTHAFHVRFEFVVDPLVQMHTHPGSDFVLVKDNEIPQAYPFVSRAEMAQKLCHETLEWGWWRLAMCSWKWCPVFFWVSIHVLPCFWACWCGGPSC